MKERNFKALSQELRDLIGSCTQATAVEVVEREESLELTPSGENDGSSFHHLAEVVDFCRCKKMSCYVMIDSVSQKVKGVIF